MLRSKSKKICAFVLITLLICSLCACNNSKNDPYAIYQDAYSKLMQATDIEYTCKTNISMTTHIAEYASFDTETNIDLSFKKSVDTDGEDILSSNISTEFAMGNGSVYNKVNTYYADGYFYYHSPDFYIKEKEAMSSEDALAKMARAELLNFDQSMITESSVTPLENNIKKVTFFLDGSKLSDSIFSVLKSMMETEHVTDFKVHEIALNLYVDKNNNLQQFTTAMTIDMETLGMPMSALVETDTKIISTADVTVQLPDDLDRYREVRK